MSKILKCSKCGFVGDAEIGSEKETGYKWEYCPECGGDMFPAYRCMECGEFFIPNEDADFVHLLLNSGFCVECLKDNFDFKIGYDYLQQNDLVEAFAEFCIEEEVPFAIKNAFVEWLKKSDKSDERNNVIVKDLLWSYIEQDLNHYSWFFAGRRGKR